jgi:hypothetical protein
MYRLANLIDQLRIETVTKTIIRSFLKCRAKEPSSFRFWSNRPLLRYAPILLWPLISCAIVPQEISKPVFIKLVEPFTTELALDFEDPGKIMVTHGSACGEADDRGVMKIIPGSFTLPVYADSATVFLNGWRLRYLFGDENLHEVRATIENIELIKNELSWVAAGRLEDAGRDDAYEFCYYYTILAWNSGRVDALVEHANRNVSFGDSRHGTTALTALSSYVQDERFMGKKSVAILPRGFGLNYSGGNDRNLLQIAYHLDHSEAFVERGKVYRLPAGDPEIDTSTSRFDETIRTWESYVILKDNDRWRDYEVDERFSALAGNDISVIEPPFTILPSEDASWRQGCVTERGGRKTQSVEIRNLPFDYAIPMLTGWDLSYSCDDENVEEIGIWLENIRYEKGLGSATGTLRYTVVSELRDEDASPGHFSRHKVSILGLNGREPADLVPHELKSQFCNKDLEGRLLVSVANNGSGDAAASSTDVHFFPSGIGTITPVTVLTPPIPRGFIATLDPIVIPSFCGGDCSFTIRVDSKSDVTEANEANNSAGGECIG